VGIFNCFQHAHFEQRRCDQPAHQLGPRRIAHVRKQVTPRECFFAWPRIHDAARVRNGEALLPQEHQKKKRNVFCVPAETSDGRRTERLRLRNVKKKLPLIYIGFNYL
jgi:hypothetical protein